MSDIVKCKFFDGYTEDGHIITECNYPWSKRCSGNFYNCTKLKMQWLASLSNKEKEKQLRRYGN